MYSESNLSPEPIIQQSWWHIEDVYFPHPCHNVRLVMDIQVPESYAYSTESLHLKSIGGEYFGGMRVYGRNNGHKEIAFIAERKVDNTGKFIPYGISIIPVYSEYPTILIDNQRWYHLKLELQYQIYDSVYDGTYEGYNIKPMWKKYPHFQLSKEEQIEECIDKIDENARLISLLKYSLISPNLDDPNHILNKEKKIIDNYAKKIRIVLGSLRNNSDGTLYPDFENRILGYLESINKSCDIIKYKHKPYQDIFIYCEKINNLTSAISDDVKKIVNHRVKLSSANHLRKRWWQNFNWLNITPPKIIVVAGIFIRQHIDCLSYRHISEYLRNSIHVVLPLEDRLQPEFYLTLPSSWRMGFLHLMDDYCVGIKNEGSSIKLIIRVVDLTKRSEMGDVHIPLNPPFISRISGGKREYKVIPTDEGMDTYLSLQKSPYITIDSMRLEYVAQISNSISLYSLVPIALILMGVLALVFQIISTVQSQFKGLDITLSVSVIVMYLTYIYSYMTLKEKGYDIPHKGLYWWSVAVLIVIIIVVILISIVCGITVTSPIFMNISNLT